MSFTVDYISPCAYCFIFLYACCIVVPRIYCIIMLPSLIGGGIKRRFCLTSACLTSVAYIGPTSRTERPGRPKLAQK